MAPVIQRSINDTGEEPSRLVLKGSAELPLSWLLSGGVGAI